MDNALWNMFKRVQEVRKQMSCFLLQLSQAVSRNGLVQANTHLKDFEKYLEGGVSVGFSVEKNTPFWVCVICKVI